MLFKVVKVGKMRDAGLSRLVAEYSRRLGAYGKLEVVDVGDSDVEGEGKSILRELDRESHSYVIVLSEEGRCFTSVEFSRKLDSLDRKAVFVIGGPFGLADEVKARADLLWSLSPLTFTHELAALLLFEQLYRACNISHGGGYHH